MIAKRGVKRMILPTLLGSVRGAVVPDFQTSFIQTEIVAQHVMNGASRNCTLKHQQNV